MDTLRYDDSRAHPLTSDDLIEQRVRRLIGRASTRQLWFLFLLDDGVQTSLLIPVSDPPEFPDRLLVSHLDLIRDAMIAENAATVIAVIERCRGAIMSPSDVAWAQELDHAFQSLGVPLRALLLSHNNGVRWIAPEDYAVGPAAG